MTQQRAILDENNLIVEVIGLEDKWDYTPPKGLRLGAKAPGELLVGGFFDGKQYQGPIIPLGKRVNIEREKRMNGGLVYDGHEFPTDAKSIDAIKEWQVMAMSAIAAGRTDLKWSNRDEEFVWWDVEKTRIPMTAIEFSQFANAVIGYRAEVKIAARNLKDLQPIPKDYADVKHWPSRTLE